MSVIIHGLNMQKDGRKHTALLQFLEDGKCQGIVEYSKSYDDRSVKVFEVVPLPEGHGRLIDADELMNRARGCLDELTILSLEFLVNGSSTIVPAEVGTKDGA